MDNSFIVRIIIIDKNQKIQNWTKLKDDYLRYDDNKILFKSLKDTLVLYLYNGEENKLMSMNSNLDLVQSNIISYSVVSLDANEKNIYCLTNDDRIVILGHKLNAINIIGQTYDPQLAFYMENTIKQIANRENKFYCLYPNKLDIIDETTGVLLKSISINGSKMAFDSYANLVVFCVDLIFKFDLNGKFENKVKIVNLLSKNKFTIDERDFFIDQQDKIIYFNNLENIYFE